MRQTALFLVWLCSQFGVTGDLEPERWVPHLTRPGAGFRTNLILSNLSDKPQTITLQPFTPEGNPLEEVGKSLDAGATQSFAPEELFGDQAIVSHFRITGSEAVKVTVSYDTETGTSSPVHVQESPNSSRTWRFFHGSDWDSVFDGLALVNVATSSANVTVHHLNSAGIAVEEAVTLGPVAPKAKLLLLLSDHFTEIPETYFEVRSKNSFSLTVLRGTFGQASFLTENVPIRNQRGFDNEILENVTRMMHEGRRIFRYDTFGDEAFWGGTLRLHESIQTLPPSTALQVGLKVDVQAIPQEVLAAIAQGAVNLEDPAITVALLQLDAVIGVKGIFEDESDPNRLTSMGIRCSLCHSTVDDSFAPSIGNRLDGWPNRDLNVGAIVALAPDLSAVSSSLGLGESAEAQDAVRAVIRGWGPGKFDAAVFLDGKIDGGPQSTNATLIPPAYGLSGTNQATFTGWGSVTYWNAFVANLEMHGQGTFFDPRLNDERFPVAAANQIAEVRAPEDLITSKLGPLNFYQMGIPAPNAPDGSFDQEAALRGQTLFSEKARCAECHVPPLYTEPGFNLHDPAEIGIDGFQAERSPTQKYRTTPLPGLWARAKGGYYHDGRFEDLRSVIDHYNDHFSLNLEPQEKEDLVQFLLSL